MREQEWDLIEVGDALDYLPLATKANPTPTPLRYQVLQLEPGTGHVVAVRLISNRDDGVSNFTATETARITKNSDQWTYVSVKAKVVATGGFVVKRADGTEEYDKCPTPRDRAKQLRV